MTFFTKRNVRTMAEKTVADPPALQTFSDALNVEAGGIPTDFSSFAALTGADSATGDLFIVRDVSAGTTKKMTRAELSDALGGGLQSQTATVTTDANTFTVEHVFDLGKAVNAILVTATVLALTPDGETFGHDAGQIQVLTEDPAGFGAVFLSTDGVTYAVDALSDVVGGISWSSNTGGIAVNDFVSLAGVAPRYIKVPVSIFDIDSFGLYAGANNPTAQVRIDVDYI